MWLLNAIAVAIFTIGLSATPQEQSGLSSLFRENPEPSTVSAQDGRVDEILERIGTIYGLEVATVREELEQVEAEQRRERLTGEDTSQAGDADADGVPGSVQR